MKSPQAPGLLRRLLAFCHWRLYLIWPAFLILVYIAFFGEMRFLSKGFNETVAPVLLGLAGLAFLARWLGERQPLVLLLLVLGIALFCRELHFAGTSSGIYVALALTVVWAILWWPNIEVDLRGSGTAPYLLFAMATYVLSQAVARRAFRGILPFEAESDLFRTGLEEGLENLAHLAVLFVALRGFPGRWGLDEDLDAVEQQPSCGIEASAVQQ